MRARQDTVSRRIGRVTVGVLLTVVLVGAVATVALVNTARRIDRLSNGYAPASDANNAALIDMLDAETGIRGYALTGNRDALEPYRQGVVAVLPELDAAAAALHEVGEHSFDDAIAAERALAVTWIDTVARPAVRGSAAARRATQTGVSKQRFDAFRRANATVGARIDSARTALRDDTSDLTGLVFPVVIVVVVLAVLGAAVAALRTARGVSRPLTTLWDAVRRLEGGDLNAQVDDSQGPAEVRAVSAAVNSLALERRRVVAAREAGDVLRRETRELTAAIRIGQDPATIAHTLTAGLGRVFDVDLVWLVTFDESRVPVLSEHWRRGVDHVDDAGEATDDLMLRGLANRLWHGSTVIGVADHEDPQDPGADLGAAHLAVATYVADARASIIAAIGEGTSAMGLLWLAMTDEPRTWTPTELGLLQHVSVELAQGLSQTHLIAQQRAAMRRLREADEAKTALVSTVSHELRTPLTSIIGYLDVLLDTHGEDLEPEVRSMLKVVERNATRLRGMIEDLLQQTEQETGRRLTELDRVDLAGVLDDVSETIAPLAANARLELEIDRPEPGSLVVDGDTRELTQALVNLAANAVKFTGQGGRVLVEAARSDGHAELRVSDTGMGIPDDEIPHLFERFFRARNARSAVIPGTGLGLAIVSDIVARHRGTIDVQSQLGRGTSFVIRLPVAMV
jgi:signal transduction histidine kinase/CHASE3 domain sensor protein